MGFNNVFDWDYSVLDIHKIINGFRINKTFMNVFSKNKDLTKHFFDDLKKRAFGKKHNHFVIEVIGETGSFKSSVSQEIASFFDPDFSIAGNMGFTNTELIEKLRFKADVESKKSQVFVRDETPDSLLRSDEIEFGQLRETLRESRISLIVIKPKLIGYSTSHYVLECVLHTKDFKYVKCGLLYPKNNVYLGFVIIPIRLNNKIWKEYRAFKQNFQQSVINRDLFGVDYESFAKTFLENHNADDYIKFNKRGDSRVVVKLLKRDVYNFFNTKKIQDKDFILATVTELIEEDKGLS